VTGGPPPLTTIAGEPVDPEVDLVRVAARGLVVAVMAGIGVAALALVLVRMLMAGAPPSDAPNAGLPFYVLVFGTFAAMGTAVFTAWRLLAPIASPFRRGVLAMITAFATFVGALLATPIHYYLGVPGLLGLSLAALGGALVLGRRRAS